jgi:predicted phage gp36 major capsid-like protein
MEEYERNEYETDDEEHGYAATSESESSVDTVKQRKTKKKKETKRSNSRSRRSSSRPRREKEQTVNKDCKHCKANRSTSRHPQIPEANCFWNPQWKGFRPKSICNQLEGAEFKARAKFTPELGGYPLADSE